MGAKPEVAWRYVLRLVQAIGLGFFFSGAGIALCGPIYGWLMAEPHTSPHTPLHVRAQDLLHEQVVSRVMASGLLLTVAGLVVAGLATWRLGWARH